MSVKTNPGKPRRCRYRNSLETSPGARSDQDAEAKPGVATRASQEAQEKRGASERGVAASGYLFLL
eukprot:9497961-Pyramimonas_sp.AAC.1